MSWEPTGRVVARAWQVALIVLTFTACACGEQVRDPFAADRDAAPDGAVGVARSALLVDNADVAPIAAYSVALKLRTAYAGPALRVRRVSDSTVLDVGFIASNRVDASAIITFCGSADCFVAVVYDQSGNARDLSQANTANQIKIYDGATRSLVGGGSSPVLSVATAGKTVERPDLIGLSGNPAFTIAYAGRYLGPGAGPDVQPIRVFGSDGQIGNQFAIGYSSAPSNIGMYIGGGDVGWATSGHTQTHRGVLMHAAGAKIDASVFRLDGAQIARTADNMGTGVFNLVAPGLTMLGKHASNGSGAGAETSSVLIWNTVLGAHDLALVEQLLAPGTTVAPSSLCYGAPGTQALAPWPMVGLCPLHRAQSPVLAAQAATLRWSVANGSGAARGAAVIAADGTIFAPSTGRLAAFNPATGATLWSVSARSPGASPAIGSDGTVYSVSSFTSLEARAPSNGSLKWSFGVGATSPAGPAIGADGTIYVTSTNGRLSALTPAGAAKWTVTRGAIWTSPAIASSGVVYVGADDGLHAVNPDGTARWSASFGTGALVRSSPAIAPDGTIYVGTDTSKLVAVNPDGTTRWTFSAGGVVRSSPAIGSDGVVYFGSRDHKVYAVNPNGTQKWTRTTGSNVDSSPAIGADGTIYIGSDDARLYGLRPTDGTVRFSLFAVNAIRSPITIGRDGTVYAGADDAKLFAMGPGSCAASDTTCDGKDDNCNGALDEGFVSQTSSCGVGACARLAATACLDGVIVGGTCAPGTAAASDTTCNAIDENCNGQNDEGYPTQATSCGVGACARTGSNTCTNGVAQNTCVAGTPAASDTTCNGVDDNCNGQNDEGFAPQATSCGFASCARTGSSSCLSGALQNSCVPASPPTSFDTTCDQVDDNCNGTVDDACNVNLVVNGTFDTAIAPNQGLKPVNNTIVNAPEMVAWDPADSTGGAGGALRVTLVNDPQNPHYDHNAGAFIMLEPMVPVGTWLRVSFRAKSVSGGTLLSVIRSWGGSSTGHFALSPAWNSYEFYTQVGYDTNAFVFNLVAVDTELLQPQVEGVFLLDDVDVRLVPPCASASCGSYSPDAIFGSSLNEVWDSRITVNFDGVTVGVNAWNGVKHGTSLVGTNAPNQPIYGQDVNLRGSNAVHAYRQGPKSLSATLTQDLIAAGTHPYIAIVHRLRTPVSQAGTASRIIELRGRSDGSGPLLAVTAAPDGSGNPAMTATYAPDAANPTVYSTSGPQTTEATLTEIWIAGDGLHFAQNGVDRPIDATATAPLAQGLRYLALANDLAGSAPGDVSYTQVVIASATPTPAQRAAYADYVHRAWGVAVSSSCTSVTACTGGDGCCPGGCETSGDGDCSPLGPCTPTNPCSNGEPGCDDDLDCEPGLSCGFGIGARFGQPAEIGLCWDPAACATLHPSPDDCGTTTSHCGLCCVPDCTASGQPDGCGGTCGECSSTSDSDDDGASDCAEQQDADPWTDPFIFNGAAGYVGASCHSAPTCAAIDSLDEIAGCFATRDGRALHSGWDFSTSDTDACQPGFGFAQPWRACGANFSVLYKAAIQLKESGTHCFRIDGSTQNQCGALFFDGEAVSTTGSTICVQRDSGVYPLSWFYETTDGSHNELHLRHCFSATGECTPSEPIASGSLRRPEDASERACAPDSACSETCPCSEGRECDPAVPHCADGLECIAGVGDRYGHDQGASVCWPPECEDLTSDAFACGTVTSHCGLCPACTPQCDGKSCGRDGCWGTCDGLCEAGEPSCTTDLDCATGLVCGIGNGARFGSATTTNVCWAPSCESPDPGQVACGTTSSPCGLCACNPDCDGRSCGADGCGGSCGACSGDQTCNEAAGVCIGPSPFAAFQELYDADTAPVGTLPGHVAVSALGDAQYAIPLEVPPGRGGIEPELSLRYDSSRGNGYLGIGWALEGLSTITSCNRTIAQDGAAGPPGFFSFRDPFCLDGQRLVISMVEAPTNGSGPQTITYRTEDDRFAKIVTTVNRFAIQGPDGQILGYYTTPPSLFTVFAKDGRIFEYQGLEDEHGNPAPDASGTSGAAEFHVFPLSKVRDRTGVNELRVEYVSRPGADPERPVREYYPRAITYGPAESLFVISFSYTFDDETPGDRPDPVAGWHNGINVQVNHLLRKVSVYVEGQSVRHYDLDYTYPGPGSSITHSQLNAVTDCADDSGTPSCKPATRFQYGRPDNSGGGLDFASTIGGAGRPNAGISRVLDMNGDGIDDVLFLDDWVSDQDDCFFGGDRVERSFRLWVSSHSADRANESTVVGHRVSAGTLLNERFDDCVGSIDVLSTRMSTDGVVDDWDNDGSDDFISMKSFERGAEGELVVIQYDGSSDTLRYTNTGIQMRDVKQSRFLDINGDHFQDLLTCTTVDGRSEWNVFFHSVTPGTPGYRNEERQLIPELTMACDRAQYAIDVDGDGTEELAVKGDPTRSPLFVWNPLLGAPNTILHIDALDLTPIFTRTNLRYGDKARVMLDVNGDGLKDVVEDSGSHSRVQINRGDGYFDVRSLTMPPIPGMHVVWDIDLDGRDDLYTVAIASTTRVARAYYWNGTDMVLGPSNIIPAAKLNTGNLTSPVLYDGNGDGLQGVMMVRLSNDLKRPDLFDMYERIGDTRERIHVITNGLGATSTLMYEPLTSALVYDPAGSAPGATAACTYPFLCRQPRRHTVWKDYEYDQPPETEGVTAPPARLFKYEYARARVDAMGRGPLGFAERVVRDQDPLSRSDKRVVETEYDNEYRDATTNAYPKAGLPKRQVSTALDGSRRFVTEVDRSYSVLYPLDGEPGARTYATVLDESTTTRSQHDVNVGIEDVLGSEVWRAIGRDEYANITIQQTIWDGDDVLLTEQAYKHQSESGPSFVAEWLISLPTTRWENYTRVSDPNVHKSRTTDRDYSWPTGLLASTVVAPDDPTHELETVFTRGDSAFNVTGIVQTAASGGMQSFDIQYDAIAEYPISIRNSKNQTTNVLYNREFGAQVRVEDPNQLVTEWHYDGFGRVAQVLEPGQRHTSITYDRTSDFLPVSIETRGSDGSVGREEFDVLGRVRTRRSSGVRGQDLLQSIGYDPDGNVNYLTVPRDAAITPPAAKAFAYDTLGRMVASVDADGDHETGCYDVRTSCLENARGFTRCEVHDARGRVVATRDPIPQPCMTALSLTLGAGNRYSYEAFGLPHAIVDAAGNTTTMQYDDWGNRLWLFDPDLGPRGVAYDAYGRSIATLDGNGRAAQLHYDVLGRLESRTEIDANGQSAETSWIWDGGDDGVQAGSGELIGAITETHSPDNVARHFEFDPGTGLLRATVDEIDGSTYRTELTRDGLQRVSQVRYPQAPGLDAFATTNTYDDFGHLIEVRDSLQAPSAVARWSLLDTDDTGQVSSELFGNGMVTARGHDALGRTRTITTGPLVFGASFQAARYWYDQNDNVNQRDDEILGRSETFGYDAEDRITVASGGAGLQAYEYDGANLKLNPQTQYQGTHPHAISFDGTYNYGYDAAGNRIEKSGAGIVERASYTPFDKPREIWNDADGTSSNVVHYAYDADQQRVRKDTSAFSGPDQPTQSTVYVGGLYERRTPANGAPVEHVYYVMAPNHVVAQVTMRAGASPEIAYLHDDDLGSTRFVTSQAGVITELDYDAFGLPRRPDWTAGTPANPTAVAVGFTGHERDEHGLVNMGGRMYDPVSRHFTSPDPVMQDAYSTPGLNRYSYVRNNPLAFVDPSGFDGEPVQTITFGEDEGLSFGPFDSGEPGAQATDSELPPIFAPDAAPLGTFDALDIPAWTTPGGELVGLQTTPRESVMGSSGAQGPVFADSGTVTVLEPWRDPTYVDRATGERIVVPWLNPFRNGYSWLHYATDSALSALTALASAMIFQGPVHEPVASPAMSAEPGAAIVKYDGKFAAGQILGHDPVTPGGRNIMVHAAERMVTPPKGRSTMSATEIDQVLDTGDTIRKVTHHPLGDTVTVQHTGMAGKPQVVVDAATGQNVITVVKGRVK